MRTHPCRWLLGGLIALLALTAPLGAQTALNTTTLSAAVAVDGQTLQVASSANMAVDDVVFVPETQEAMTITEVTTTTLIRVIRGTQGTRQEDIPNGATLMTGVPERFSQRSPAGSCTATSELFAPRIVLPTGTIYDCSLHGLWVKREIVTTSFEGPVTFVGGLTVRENFNQGFFIHQDDMSAESVTDDEDNVVHGSPLGVIEYREELTKTTSSWVVADGTLDISADDTTDNEGVEILFGVAEGTDFGYFVAGTDGACISASITIADISGTDQVQIGFRQNEAFVDANDYTGYTVWNTVGVNATDGSIVSSQEVSEATDTDDSGVNWADAETRALKVCVDADGVPTAYYSAASPTDIPVYTPITMTNTGSTWTAAVQGVPYFSYLAAGTDGADVVINWVQLDRIEAAP